MNWLKWFRKWNICMHFKLTLFLISLVFNLLSKMTISHLFVFYVLLINPIIWNVTRWRRSSSMNRKEHTVNSSVGTVYLCTNWLIYIISSQHDQDHWILWYGCIIHYEYCCNCDDNHKSKFQFILIMNLNKLIISRSNYDRGHMFVIIGKLPLVRLSLRIRTKTKYCRCNIP